MPIDGSKSDCCDQRIFQALFDRHAQELYNFLYYKFGAANTPEDLVQESFMKLWQNCKNIPPEKARSFLFTVARNRMLNQLDRKKTVLHHRKIPVKSYDHETPQYLLEGEEYLTRLQTALEELKEDQRVAFLLNRIEGKKHQEIAELLGVSRKTVEKRIYGALAELRKKLGDLQKF